MTILLENETDTVFPFNPLQVATDVVRQVLWTEECPYETQISILITDNEGIRVCNRDFRGLDQETDVLSFPAIAYERPSDFTAAQLAEADNFDPDSGELILGDIIVSADRVREQAEEYGHSLKREFAFLIAHSVLHLCGYDHIQPQEAGVMEAKQEAALEALHITRTLG